MTLNESSTWLTVSFRKTSLSHPQLGLSELTRIIWGMILKVPHHLWLKLILTEELPAWIKTALPMSKVLILVLDVGPLELTSDSTPRISFSRYPRIKRMNFANGSQPMTASKRRRNILRRRRMIPTRRIINETSARMGITMEIGKRS